MNRLAGKTILITGASQGLGREIALRFARVKARLVFPLWRGMPIN
jgi:NAD(P)-dependent dehydrogenase (short-subunit alcohol dehydrogenase family)